MCSLAPPALVSKATGQPGEPTSRVLTRIDGYDALVDQCGFGVSFDSFTLVLSVGLAPAGPRDLAGLPGKKASVDVSDLADAARATENQLFSTVSFVKGATLVQLSAVRSADDPSRLRQVVAVARQVAGAVPDEPPATDAQTRGACADLDPQAVEGVLGGPTAVSRSLTYKDGSIVCSFATGVRKARAVSVSRYTNRQAGPFLADQKSYSPSTDVPGVAGDAFTIPGTAYVVAEDGQAISVTGDIGSPGMRKPAPVTPQLTALLTSAAALLG